MVAHRHCKLVYALYELMKETEHVEKADVLLDEITRVHLELDKQIQPVHMLSHKHWVEVEEGWET